MITVIHLVGIFILLLIFFGFAFAWILPNVSEDKKVAEQQAVVWGAISLFTAIAVTAILIGRVQ